MKLSEFYKERMAANPNLTRRMLVDEIGSATVYAIQHDVPRAFRKSTLQKLAELWKCSIGDIQACMAETPNPLRKEAEKPEGQAWASIIAKKVPAKKNTVEPEPEPEPEVDIMFPVEEPAEEPEETLEEFKQRLKMMCLKEMTMADTYEPSAQVFMHIGKRLVEELVK